MKQIIKRVDFINSPEGLIAGFSSLIDDSHRKQLATLELDTLEQMNNAGWKLETFSLIWDERDLKMQVAIFSLVEN